MIFTSMSSVPRYILNTGAKIPALAIGTYGLPGPKAYKSVLHALRVGYRHIDTAALHGNEVEIGKAIRDSGIPREEIFVTTKFHPVDFHDVEDAFKTSMRKLDIGYIDLYLMHFPVPLMADGQSLDRSITFIDGYLQMQALPKDKAKAIGISNFDTVNLKILMQDSRVTTVPAVNQVELHANLAQTKLLEAHKRYGIISVAFATLGQGTHMSCPILNNIAQKHGITPASVTLSWAIQRGTVALAKSVDPRHIESNLTLIELDADDLMGMEEANKTIIRLFDPWPHANCYHDNIDTK